ncbi:MAG: DUF3347 domain-containing protein [Bacteroidetes bacterium]|nr:DUF3347 domain-containing protein [Bacteroidota bacterium]
MENSIKILMAMFISMSFTVCNAQIKNSKTETVKIYGNCEICESTIEKAGSLKKVAQVDWNKDTKMASITYDSSKTTKDEVLKRIALAGYDSESFYAPNDTYANLADCCQYERAKKQGDYMSMDHSRMQNAKEEMKMQTAVVGTNQLQEVFDNYFAIKDALVKTDGNTASAKATELSAAINAVKMNKLSMDVHMVWMKVLEELKQDAEHITETKDAGLQRDHFMTLSKNMYALIKVSKFEEPVYYQFCPMANDGLGANWLSKEDTIKNPYYGSQMLSCGSTVETIK